MANILLGMLSIFLFLGAATATASVVYQEAADVTTCSSGGNVNWSTGHECALTYDDDWGTYGLANDGNASSVILSYDVPAYMTDATWEVKADSGAENVTLTADCLAQSPILLKVISNGAPTNTSVWACWNGSVYTTVAENPGTANAKVYEEAIYWDIDTPEIVYTLTDTGAGVGGLFTGIGQPVMVILILLGVAVLVIGIMGSLGTVIKKQ